MSDDAQSTPVPVLLGGDGQPLDGTASPSAPAILRNQTGPGGATGWFSDDPKNDTLGREILGDLHAAYPHHRWFVRIDGGIVIVFNYSISGKWGMINKLSELNHDANVRKRLILSAAGELLERASMRRAARVFGHVPEALEVNKFGKATVKVGLTI